jgi:DNA uptake protein ComE-like DNA-binding protein/Tfp pilus assembly protein PilX
MPDSTIHKRQLTVGRRDRSALVLVLVLIVVMMVALAGFTFAELMLTENKATRLHGEQLRLQQAIHSGVEHLKQFIEQPQAAQEAAGGTLDNPRLFQAVSLEPELRDARTPVNQLCFSIVAPAPEASSPQNLGIRFGIENESGRLHLADLLRYEQQIPNGGRDALMKLPGMTEAVAEGIMDWIDADSQPRPLGAENDYYGGLTEPYSPRNALPECLEELLLVKGVTRELLFGGDANYNRILEPGEQVQPAGGSRSTSSSPTLPWSWFLTLYSGQRNRDSQGQPRINVNGSNLVELHQKLTAAVGPEVAAFLVAYRQYGPNRGADAPTSGSVPFDAKLPPLFALQSVLELAAVSVAVPAGKSDGKAQVYQSPLSTDSASFEKLNKLMDATTLDEAPVRRGLVSVNDAPAIVLQTVPGLDESLAQQIVSARQNAPSANQDSRRHPTWLLTEGLVDLETMKRLLPYLSGSGDVVRAQVIAHFNQPGLSARAEVVIDGTGDAPREVLWRDLRFYGAGYPIEWLTAGAPRGARN